MDLYAYHYICNEPKQYLHLQNNLSVCIFDLKKPSRGPGSLSSTLLFLLSDYPGAQSSCQLSVDRSHADWHCQIPFQLPVSIHLICCFHNSFFKYEFECIPCSGFIVPEMTKSRAWRIKPASLKTMILNWRI